MDIPEEWMDSVTVRRVQRGSPVSRKIFIQTIVEPCDPGDLYVEYGVITDMEATDLGSPAETQRRVREIHREHLGRIYRVMSRAEGTS